MFKPRINEISDIYLDLIQFESKINRNIIKSICEDLCDLETDNDKKCFWKTIGILSSGDIRSELLDLIDESFEEFNEYNSLVKMQDLDLYSNNCKIPDTFSSDVVDKIITSDFDSAVSKCLDAQRFSDALFIANYGGKELRERTEDYIMHKNGQFYLNMAKSIGRNEFESFVYTSPIAQWRNILKAICLHAKPESLPSLTKILYSRFINEGMERPALFAAIVSRDFEKIMEIYLGNMRSNIQNDIFSSNIMDNLIKSYKLLRILEYICPNYVEYFDSTPNKIAVFEIVVKIKALLSSFGFDDKFIYNFQKESSYTDHIKNKNTEIDVFIESRLENLSPQLVKCKMPPPVVPTFTGNASNENIQLFSTSTCSQNIIPACSQINTAWRVSSVKYNDAPIVNPKLSKLSPQIGDQGK